MKVPAKLREELAIPAEYSLKNDQKQWYSELNGENQSVAAAPNKQEATSFWSRIWSKPVQHTNNAKWITLVRDEV